MTNREFITSVLGDYGDQSSLFQTSLEAAKLDDAAPEIDEDGDCNVNWDVWVSPVHVWTVTNAYSIQMVQDENTGEIECRTCMIPREPSHTMRRWYDGSD